MSCSRTSESFAVRISAESICSPVVFPVLPSQSPESSSVPMTSAIFCNEGAQNLTLPRPKASLLLTQMRRAGGDEQLEVLKWLVHKYPKQAKSISSRTGE